MQLDLLTSSQEGSHASHTVSPGSSSARQMTATSGRKCVESYGRLAPLSSSVRTLMESSDWHSIACFLTWKPWVTRQKRLLFRLVPSTPRTGEIGSGLLPTPGASDHKSESMSRELVARRQSESARGVRLTEYLHRKMLPTPNAGNDHWGGRLDELGGSGNVFRGTEIGRARINPRWMERMMGYPPGWTDCEPSAMPSCPKLPK